MKVSRIQGHPFDSIETSESKYFQAVFKKGMKMIDGVPGLIVDPFARNCLWGDMRNDLNTNTKAEYHMEAKAFMEMVLEKHGSGSMKCLLFDPPFSSSQFKKYEKTSDEEILNIYATPGYIPAFFATVEKLLAPGGIIIKLGYNTSRPYPSLELVEVVVVNFGANRNDVLCSIWRNPNQSLLSFSSEE